VKKIKKSSAQILSLSQLATAAAADVVHQIITYVSEREHSPQARLAAETSILWFARKRWEEYRNHDFRTKLHTNPATQSLSVPLDRISAVTACMNRNSHMVQALPTWIKSKRFEEIIIIDYGSLQPLDETLSETDIRTSGI
jgi:hypothetical protein